MPGVSAPSSVVRSIIRTARSSAKSFDSRLIERCASVAARSSTATWSTEPIWGSAARAEARSPAGEQAPAPCLSVAREGASAPARRRPPARRSALRRIARSLRSRLERAGSAVGREVRRGRSRISSRSLRHRDGGEPAAPVRLAGSARGRSHDPFELRARRSASRPVRRRPGRLPKGHRDRPLQRGRARKVMFLATAAGRASNGPGPARPVSDGRFEARPPARWSATRLRAGRANPSFVGVGLSRPTPNQRRPARPGAAPCRAGSKPIRRATSSLDGRVPSRKSSRRSSPVSARSHQSAPTSAAQVRAELGGADPGAEVVGRVEAVVHVGQVAVGPVAEPGRARRFSA